MTKPVLNDEATAKAEVAKWLHKPEHDPKPGQDEQTRSDDPTTEDHEPAHPVTDPPEES